MTCSLPKARGSREELREKQEDRRTGFPEDGLLLFSAFLNAAIGDNRKWVPVADILRFFLLPPSGGAEARIFFSLPSALD